MIPFRTLLPIVLIFVLLQISAFAKEAPIAPTAIPIPKSFAPFHSVKVALLVDEPSVSLEASGPYEFRNGVSLELLEKGDGPLDLTLRARFDGISLTDDVYDVDVVTLETRGEPIRIGNRSYFDQIQVVKQIPPALTVINRVNLETYLRGVLPVEVSAKWPMAALKAHAVISRTYALFKSVEKQNELFALRDSVASQVYRGARAEREATNEAIRATRGEILIFDGKLFPTYFHASCGGQTTSADSVWRVKPHAALQGTVCKFCRGTKHYDWRFELPLKEIETVMQAHGYPAKNLQNIHFLDQDESGRVGRVQLEYKKSSLALKGTDFRAFLGYERLKSLRVYIDVRKKSAQFHGYGWGHGVGLCQWGAKGQAESGKTYLQILAFYYPGSELKTI